ITSTEPAPVQAFSATEALPKLPTVLENLAPLQPLGFSKPLAQQSDFPLGAVGTENSGVQPTTVQRKPEAASAHASQDNFSMSSLPTVQVPPVNLDNEPFTLQRFAPDTERGKTPASTQETRPLENSALTRKMPSSWSSIADLLGESNTDSTSAWGGETPIQKKSVSSGEENFLALTQLSSFGTIQKYSNPADTNSVSSLQNLALNGTSVPSKEQESVSEVASVDNPSKEQDSKEKDSKTEDLQGENSNNLEILAREIYGLIRQRLTIEQERQGGYYSSRLPW
ncbi:MAG TPA: hypothetical protein DCP31_11620, partial [Cyanobacteria bacterium UBA8543]|nr:hypothetical protein [Cyanobacteria bacterium UBA8543]